LFAFNETAQIEIRKGGGRITGRIKGRRRGSKQLSFQIGDKSTHVSSENMARILTYLQEKDQTNMLIVSRKVNTRIRVYIILLYCSRLTYTSTC
jgi:hypothetical protein